jgi:hypothetical protein
VKSGLKLQCLDYTQGMGRIAVGKGGSYLSHIPLTNFFLGAGD